jgi:uroporphyrin-III C-methyltransferase/precorrin-2 dehydrogenase/sirohydrochlorin ferrochelatase
VRFITGHRKDGSVELPHGNLNTPSETLVFYMGLLGLAQICEKLQGQGMAADMPAAIISRGTLPDQQVVMGTVSTLAEKAQREQVSAPSLVIIGTVVTLHPRYHWFRHSSP